MNILILSHKPPYPIVDGGCHAMDRFLRDALRAFPEANFNYLSIATQKHDFDENEIPEELKKRATFDHVKISTKLNPNVSLKFSSIDFTSIINTTTKHNLTNGI